MKMEVRPEQNIKKAFYRFGICSAAICMLIGTAHFLAWISGYMAARGAIEVTMKTNTSILLMALGAAVLLLATRRFSSLNCTIGHILACIAMIVGYLTLLENVFGWDFHIDQLIVREPPGALGVPSPNRMGTPASISVTLAGAALLIRDLRRGQYVSQLMILMVLLIGVFGTVGFWYGIRDLYAINRVTSIAFPSALALIFLAAGILCTRPFEGIMALITAEDAGGRALRRLLTVSTFFPLLFGYLRLVGERQGYFGSAMGTALLVILMVTSFWLVLYLIARDLSLREKSLRRSEQELRQTTRVLDEERLKLDTAITTMPVGVVISDIKTTELSMNKAALRLHGFASEEEMYTSLDQYQQHFELCYLDGRIMPFSEWPASRALQGEFVRDYQLAMRNKKNGTERIISYSTVLLSHNRSGPELVLYTLEDLTERKKAEQALRQLNETLEHQVAIRTRQYEERTNQLQALSVELIEAEERERQRIAQVLHDDLQQMLAGARMMLQSAIGNMPSIPEIAEVQHLLEESIKKSRSLSHELSPAVLHHSGLVAALEWLTGQMKAQFGLNVELEKKTDTRLENESIKVFAFRAVQELLFNIVKHAGVNSARVEISDSTDAFFVIVSDQGRGFNPEVLKKSQGKVGFGLLTIRERANYIGIKFVIDSAPDRGSRFTLKIPLGMVRAKGPQPQRAARVSDPLEGQEISAILPAAGTIRVLFADDHKVMRQGLIKLIAGQPGIHVIGEASNGLEAIDQARRLNPDVIVMDISMPIMDGVEATRRIKAELPEVRVVGLSMHDDVHIANSMCGAGAESLVNKASSPAKLLKAIYGVTQEKTCAV